MIKLDNLVASNVINMNLSLIISDIEDIDPNITKGNLSISTNPDVLESQGLQNMLPSYASIPILFMSLFLGHLIRSYHNTLIPLEKTTIVLLDIGITNYLQEI